MFAILWTKLSADDRRVLRFIGKLIGADGSKSYCSPYYKMGEEVHT